MGVSRVVLDSNLFVSLLLGSPKLASFGKLIRSGKIRLILSPAQIAELTDVLHRPKFDFQPSEIKELFEWLGREALLVTASKLPFPVCRDSKDDFLLAAALAGKADAVITGDKDLLVLRSYGSIPILAPADFIASLT